MRSTSVTALGLTDQITACLFDLDGVVTQTAKVHARAWKQTFDSFLERRARQGGEPFTPFHIVSDYDEYVDGKPRVDGVRSFLAGRHITAPDDEIARIAAQKDELFKQLIHRDGVETYETSVRYIEAVCAGGRKIAVVSSSKNTTEVLHAAHLDRLFDAQVDGNIAEREHLNGKPAPDTYLRAARMLGAAPSGAAVYEDALAGVEAGRAGRFGLVVGIDRAGQAGALKAHGADIVVKDLGELLSAA